MRPWAEEESMGLLRPCVNLEEQRLNQNSVADVFMAFCNM